LNKQIDQFVKEKQIMEKDFKTQLYNKEAQIIQLQTK
jgi:hypothetical protein